MCKDCKKFCKLEEFINMQTQKESALISVLHQAQNLYGYLSKETLEYISTKLEIPLSKIYGVVTFYSYFTTEPKGKYVISICTGTACFVKGAGEVLSEFEKLLNIKAGETTQDGLFTLDTLRCVGACGLAPVVTINDKIYGKITKNDVKKVLGEYKE
ncbi:MAG: NADH-quinone oxidoreductase subunit NuoE [Clostridium sp.]